MKKEWYDDRFNFLFDFFLQVNKLRDKMETILKSKIAGGEISPQDIKQEVSKVNYK